MVALLPQRDVANSRTMNIIMSGLLYTKLSADMLPEKWSVLNENPQCIVTILLDM